MSAECINAIHAAVSVMCVRICAYTAYTNLRRLTIEAAFVGVNPAPYAQAHLRARTARAEQHAATCADTNLEQLFMLLQPRASLRTHKSLATHIGVSQIGNVTVRVQDA
jgi:hypothetical protein